MLLATRVRVRQGEPTRTPGTRYTHAYIQYPLDDNPPTPLERVFAVRGVPGGMRLSRQSPDSFCVYCILQPTYTALECSLYTHSPRVCLGRHFSDLLRLPELILLRWRLINSVLVAAVVVVVVEG